jgi:two-component system nitrogen regulation response regulator NtrX
VTEQSRVVVVVDDEPDILNIICDVLQDEGYQVVCLNHPVLTENLKRDMSQLDLFMLDIMLPEMSGIDLARRLREEGYPETPIIAMSASPGMLQMARHAGLFQDTLPKPFDLDSLLHTVEHQIELSEG